MGKLYDQLKHYFETSSKEDQNQDWEELKSLNDFGPDIFEYVRSIKSNRDLCFDSISHQKWDLKNLGPDESDYNTNAPFPLAA
jgi:hypothetical protein